MPDGDYERPGELGDALWPPDQGSRLREAHVILRRGCVVSWTSEQRDEVVFIAQVVSAERKVLGSALDPTILGSPGQGNLVPVRVGCSLPGCPFFSG